MTNFIRIIKEEYSFRQYLVCILSFYLFVLLVGFLFQSDGVLFDVRSLMASVALVILILWMIRRPDERSFGLWAMIAVIFLIFIFPRILMYLLAPSLVTFPFGQNIGREIISRGLTYILLGTSALAVGQILYQRFRPVRDISKNIDSNSSVVNKLPLLLIVFLIFLATQIYISAGLGINPYRLNPRMPTFISNTLVQFINVTIDSDVLLVICLIILLARSDLSEKIRWLFAISIVACLMFTTAYLGGRASSIRVLMILIGVLLARYGNFRLSIGRIAFVMLLLFLIGWCSYSFATMQRMKIVASYNAGAMVPNEKSLAPKADKVAKYLGSTKADKVAKYLGSTKADKVAKYLGSTKSILDRLGVLDYAILVPTQPADQKVKEKIMTFEYTLKSLINSLPGTPFPEAELSTSRLVTALFRPETPESYIKSAGYCSEFYTAWGLSFLFFGWWWGVLALCIVGVILAALQDFVKMMGQWSVYFNALFIWITPLTVILSMGMDHSIFFLFVMSLRLSTALIILTALNTLVSKSKLYYAKKKVSSSLAER